MQKRLLFLVIALAMLSSACSSQTTATETNTPTIPATATKVSPTATATALSPTETATTEASFVQAPPGCSTYTLIPTPNPEDIALFPAEQQGDWVLGPVTADITILEYSDFQ